MKINKYVLPLLLVVLMALSVSAVSATDVGNNTDDASLDVSTYSNTVEIPDGANSTVIQDAIDGAAEGDTVSFASNGSYTNVGALNVNKTIEFVGNGATLTSEDIGNNTKYNMFTLTSAASGTSFTGLNFVLVKDGTSTDNINGYVIYANGAGNITVTNCDFVAGACDIYLRGVTGSVTIDNNRFTGYTNVSSVGTEDEQGTKCINVMGGNGVTVTNNEFYGNPLDGVSIASNSKNVDVINNTFSGNTYGIFFGGGVQNVVIENNAFINTTQVAIDCMKSQNTRYIKNNKFVLLTGTTAIYLVQGDTHHGYPTTINGIYITENDFSAAEGANPYSIKAVDVLSQGGPLTVAGPFEITDNTYDAGVKLFTFTDSDWFVDGNESQINITPTTYTSSLSQVDQTLYAFSGSNFTTQLFNSAGNVLANETVTFTINGKEYNRTTDENGYAHMRFNIQAGTFNITYKYLGNDAKFVSGCTGNASVTIVPASCKIALADTTVTKGTQAIATLTNVNGQAIANAVVSFVVNTKLYQRTTDANGVAKLNINLNSGSYGFSAVFNGNNNYLSSGTSITMNVVA